MKYTTVGNKASTSTPPSPMDVSHFDDTDDDSSLDTNDSNDERESPPPEPPIIAQWTKDKAMIVSLLVSASDEKHSSSTATSSSISKMMDDFYVKHGIYSLNDFQYVEERDLPKNNRHAGWKTLPLRRKIVSIATYLKRSGCSQFKPEITMESILRANATSSYTPGLLDITTTARAAASALADDDDECNNGDNSSMTTTGLIIISEEFQSALQQLRNVETKLMLLLLNKVEKEAENDKIKQQQQQQQQPKDDGSSLAATQANTIKSPSSSSTRRVSSNSAWLLWTVAAFIRAVVLETPLLLTAALYLSSNVLIQLGDEYMFPQMKLLKWTRQRRESEVTYYSNYCSKDDITASNAAELTVNYTSMSVDDCKDHALTHGISIFPQVLSDETADKVREYVHSNRHHTMKQSFSDTLLESRNRYSGSVDINGDPAVHRAMQEIAEHPFVRPVMEKLLGPNPAVIEFSDITAAYGAKDQNLHTDTKFTANAFNYAQSFVPSYSLFIPLQDTTAEMGATEVCPGSHMCYEIEEYCKYGGGAFQVSNDGKDNIWPKGYGALMNQQTLHRGMGHRDGYGKDRVMLVFTFAPRPNEVLENRHIGQGLPSSIYWSQWGHTLDDYANAPTRMQQPWQMLRSLGLYKPSSYDWGWDFVSNVLARAGDKKGYVATSDVQEFVDGEVKWDYFPWKYIPKFLIPTKVSDDTKYYEFVSETLDNIRQFSLKLLVGCTAFYVNGMTLWGAVAGFKGATSSWFYSIRRLVLIVGCWLLVVHLAFQHVSHTQWAKNIVSGKSFNPGISSKPYETDLPATLPYRTDVLVNTRNEGERLFAHSELLDFTHPGNRDFKTMVDNAYQGYNQLPDSLRMNLVSSIVQRTRGKGGRFLTMDHESSDWIELNEESTIEACHKALTRKSDLVLNEVLRELSYLLANTKYGPLRHTSMHRDHTTKLLQKLETALLHPPSLAQQNAVLANAMATISRTRHPQSNILQPRSFLNSVSIVPSPRTIGKGLYSRLLPRQEIKEPTPGAWLKVGDMVSARLKGWSNEWYMAKIINVNPDDATFDVQHEKDGYIDRDLCRWCVRRYESPKIGDDVTLVDDDNDLSHGEVELIRLEGTTTHYVVTESAGQFHYVEEKEIVTRNPIWETGSSVEVRESDDEDDDWVLGIITKDYGGDYAVEYISGRTERDIPTTRIRPANPY